MRLGYIYLVDWCMCFYEGSEIRWLLAFLYVRKYLGKLWLCIGYYNILFEILGEDVVLKIFLLVIEDFVICD